MAGNAQHLILKMRAHLGPPARFVWNGIPYNFRGTVMPLTENDPVWERVVCHKANTKDFFGKVIGKIRDSASSYIFYIVETDDGEIRKAGKITVIGGKRGKDEMDLREMRVFLDATECGKAAAHVPVLPKPVLGRSKENQNR